MRHGQSAPYREGYPFPLVDGQGDPALSPLGEWQAQQVADRLAGIAIDAVYVTTLRRTHQTAAPLLARLGLTLDRFDVVEINEAFAAQVLACLRQLGVPDDAPQVNPNGGAIALGHPLGMSGARLALTAMRTLERGKGRFALCTLCVGVGQGLSVALERV